MPRKKITPFNDEFDPKLFVSIAKKNSIWFVLFMFIAILSTFLYLRYTVPVYEARSIIKLSDENRAGLVLGKSSEVFDNINQLAGDIELLRSRIIAKRAIEKLPLTISYFAKGTVLDFELYKASPFKVSINIKDSSIFNRPFYLEFEDQSKFILRYTYKGEKFETQTQRVNEWVVLPFGTLKITISDFENISSQQLEVEQSAYYFIINDLDILVTRVLKNLLVTPLNADAKTVMVKLKDKNPNKAAEIVNQITEEFNAYDVERSSEAANSILNFIDTTIFRVNTSLSTSEDDLEDFKRENRIFDPNEAVREVSSKLSELENIRAELQFNLYLYEKINKEIEENEEVSTFLIQLAGRNHDGSLDNEITALHQLLDERSQILIQSTYETEVYKAHEMKIESQKNILLQIIKNEIATLKDKVENVDQQIDLLDSRYGTLPEKQAVYGRLERLYSIHEKFYSLLLEKKAEFSITRAGFVTKNIILERAIPINFPISPKKALIISSSLIVGFVLSFLLIIVKYLLHDQIDIISDIEPYTDAAILGIIPKYKREIPISQLLVDKNPKSIIAEAFRSIRTNLQFISNEKDAKIIALTSTISGEGKTFNAINLAGVIAFSGKKVVILDLDMRKPKIHLGFNVENNKGISTLLIGKDKVEECIISSSLENLHFITAGPVPPNPSELIISKRMDELLEYLKTKFDIIIIDTPPVGIVSDGIPMIKRADFPIYILRANYSRKLFIHNINKLIDENKVKNLSLILNGIDLSRLKYGYGYNYSYSYGYGYGYGYTYGYGYGYYEEDMKEPTRIEKIKAFLFRDKKS